MVLQNPPKIYTHPVCTELHLMFRSYRAVNTLQLVFNKAGKIHINEQ